jgi:hypothetical protein
MTKQRLQWVFACCVLLLAAAVWAQLPSGPPGPGEVALSINARGGTYLQLEVPLKENDQDDVALSIDSKNDDPQWGATIVLCVLGEPPSEQVCLRFANAQKNVRVLTALKGVVGKDGKTVLNSDDLQGSYRIGETIKVDLRVSPESVEFRINEGAPIKQRPSFAPHILRMGCSSALCTYRLK